MIWLDIFSKTCRWPAGTWKDPQHHQSSGKSKSKPQWDIISHLWEWLLAKEQDIGSVSKNMENRETTYWWECKLVQSLLQTFWRYLKKLKITCHFYNMSGFILKIAEFSMKKCFCLFCVLVPMWDIEEQRRKSRGSPICCLLCK